MSTQATGAPTTAPRTATPPVVKEDQVKAQAKILEPFADGINNFTNKSIELKQLHNRAQARGGWAPYSQIFQGIAWTVAAVAIAAMAVFGALYASKVVPTMSFNNQYQIGAAVTFGVGVIALAFFAAYFTLVQARDCFTDLSSKATLETQETALKTEVEALKNPFKNAEGLKTAKEACTAYEKAFIDKKENAGKGFDDRDPAYKTVSLGVFKKEHEVPAATPAETPALEPTAST